MLKVTKISVSGGVQASQVADYYKGEEKHLNLQECEMMTKDEASSKSLADNQVLQDYGDYVLAESKDDRSLSQWSGELAKMAGLDGKEVTKEQLAQVLEGNFLGQTVQKRSDGARRAGYDFTFSAPKSVSVMALLYGDKRLIDVHQKAVKEAMEEVARMCPEMRIQNPATKEVERIATDKVLYSMETHKTSRELDPQLHTHAILANMTVDDNGKLRAITVDSFFEQKMNKFFGTVYQASLCKQAGELGYKTHSVGNGQFEITGVSKEFLDSFSQRREQIKSSIKSFGAKNANTIDSIAKFSRKDKREFTESLLNELWDDRRKAFDGASFLQQVMATAKESQGNMEVSKGHESAHYALQLAVDHVSRYQTKMDYNQLISKTLVEFSIDQKINIDDIKRALDEQLKSGSIISLNKNTETITTQKQIDDEKHIHTLLGRQVKNMRTVTNSKVLEELTLKGSNSKVVNDVLSSSKQANMIEVSGSSKDAISALIHLSENSKKRIKVLSPNHYHLQDVGANTKRQANSIFQWVRNQFKGDYVQTLGGFLYQQNQKNTLENKDIIVVDQSDKLSVKDTQKILELTGQGKAKVVFINQDTARDSTTRSGNISETLKQGNINSFKWDNQKTVTAALKINEIKNDTDRVKEIASQYAQFSIDEKSHTQIVANSKKEVNTLNLAIRDEMSKNGSLSHIRTSIDIDKPVYLSPEQKQVAKSYNVGQRLDFFTQDKGKLSYQIVSIDAPNNLIHVANEKGHASSFDPRNNKNSFNIIKKESFEIAESEKLLIHNTYNKRSSIKSGLSYTVDSFDKDHIRLRDETGKLYKTSRESFSKSNIQYDYARTLDYVSFNDKKNIISTAKQYAIDKETAAELLLKANKSVTMYTDNSEKLSHKIKQSGVQPSTISTILQSHDKSINLSKYVSKDTKSDLAKDINTALSALQIQYNRSELTKSVEYAVGVLSDRQAAFEHKDLITLTIEHCQSEFKQAISLKDVQSELDKLKTEGKLLSNNFRTNTLWTTKEVVETEKAIVKLADNGANKVSALSSQSGVKDHLEKNTDIKLTEGQKEAVNLISTTTDRFVAVQGYAGTGKSTMLQQAQTIAMIEQVKNVAKGNGQDIEFIGLAPTHQAVKELENKAISSQTAKSLLFEESQKYLTENTNNDLSNKVFLLDESSMISNNDFKDFMSLVDKSNARAVFIGDIKQLQSLESGAPFRLLVQGEKINTAYMLDIKRQESDENYLKTVYSLIDDKPYLADKFLQKQEGNKHIKYKKDKTTSNISINESALSEKEIKQINDNEKNIGKIDSVINQAKVENMLDQAAHEYLSRTKEAREDTLIVANSHSERDAITETIRKGLKTEGTLDKENTIIINQLKNLDKSETEMTKVETYKDAHILQKGKDDYYFITNIDETNRLLTLKHTETGKESYMAPARANHRFNGLYEIKQSELAINDKILIRKTNKDKGIVANQEFKVTGIDKETGHLTFENKDKKVSLDSNKINEMHWDYGYTKTTYSSQGATYPFVISVDNSRSPLADILSDYVKKSRGAQHVMVFTDNKKAYLDKVAKTNFSKHSALAVLNKVKLGNHLTKNDSPNQTQETLNVTNSASSNAVSPNDKSNGVNTTTDNQEQRIYSQIKETIKEKVYDQRYLDHNGKFDIRRYGKEVAKSLTENAESVTKSILGKPNSHSTGSVLAYGQKSGSFKVNISGKYQGHWKDWDTGEKGDMISLIMKEQGVNYSEAVLEGAKMMAMPETYQIKETPRDTQIKTPVSQNQSKTLDYGQKLWQQSHQVKGSLAEKYLIKHRGIKSLDGADIRFHPNVFSKESNQKYQPALLAGFTDKDGNIKAVEAIYLDRRTAKKADFKVAKRSYGAKKSSAVTISEGSSKNNITLLAEGLETSMSLKEARPDLHILSVGGKENFANIDPKNIKGHVILCADNDNSDLSKDKAIVNAVNHLEREGKHVTTIMPQNVGNQFKTDYNDILKHEGKDTIKHQLNDAVKYIKDESKMIDSVLKNANVKANLSSDEIKKAISYIRSTGDLDVPSIITAAKVPDNINQQTKIDQKTIDGAVVFAKISSLSHTEQTKVNHDAAVKQMMKNENEITK